MEQPTTHRHAGVDKLNRRHRPRVTRRTTSAPKKSSASAVTNGTKILLPLSHGAWVRRLRDLLEGHVADLGGWDIVSNSEMALVRRCSVLIVELERRESLFAQAGYADDVALAVYGTSVNTLRRCLETLGLQRRARNVNVRPLDEIIAELDAKKKAVATTIESEAAE